MDDRLGMNISLESLDLLRHVVPVLGIKSVRLSLVLTSGSEVQVTMTHPQDSQDVNLVLGQLLALIQGLATPTV
jgi:hypothetical protein